LDQQDDIKRTLIFKEVIAGRKSATDARAAFPPSVQKSLFVSTLDFVREQCPDSGGIALDFYAALNRFEVPHKSLCRETAS